MLGILFFGTGVTNKTSHIRNLDLVYLVILSIIKFVYSEKATKFCEISTLLLTTVHTDKSKVEISQNFVAFSEYMNFTKSQRIHRRGK